jgi:hypothetical protein
MSPPEAPLVTVVSGVPRSGTSLMMAMLGAGGHELLIDDRRPADADNPNGYYEYGPVAGTRSDAAWMIRAAGKAVKVVHALLPDLPAACRYRVIFMRREMREIVASQRAMLGRLGQRGAGLGAEQLGRVFEIEIARTLGWLRSQPHVRLLEVDYNLLIREPRVQANRVARFLGDRMDADAMAAVVEPRLYRQRH